MFAIDTLSSRYTFFSTPLKVPSIGGMSVHLSLYRFCEDNFSYRINICRFSDDVLGVYLERNNREPVGTFKLRR